MTGNLKLLINFVWKFMGIVCFGNDHVVVILGFGDLQWGNILITRVYFVEGLGHNFFSVGQFCDSDLEVAFRRNACFVRNLKGVDFLKGDRSTNLYTISLHEMDSASPISLIARASSTKSWLWHQRLSHLNFDTINDLARNDLVSGLPKFNYNKEHLCPYCEQGKSKRASHPLKPVPNSRQRLHRLHMDLCGPMRIASINEKQYVLVIVDDYSRYTWVHFLRFKDEAPKVIKTFLKRITVLFQIYNRRTKKIMETMNVSFDELLVMDFEQRSLKPGLQSMTYGQISSGLDLTYAPSTITTQQPTEGELDLLFEAMCDDYIGGQPSATVRTVLTAQESQDVDELNLNAMFDGNSFVNPFATSSTSPAESSSLQNVDPSNMHTFYQPYPHEFQWTKDHPLEQVIGEPSQPVLTRNKLQSDGDMCMYALTVSTMEPKNVKEAMTDPAWIDSMQEDLLQFKRLDVWVLVPAPDNISPLTLKWLFKNKHDEEQTGGPNGFKPRTELSNPVGNNGLSQVTTARSTYQLSANDKAGFGHNGAKESKVSETITGVSKVETRNSKISNDKVEMPKIKTSMMSEPIIEEWESDSEDDEIVVKPKEVTRTVKPSFEKIESVNARNETVRQAKNPRKNNKSPRGNKRNWNGMMTQKLGENFEFNNKACYVCGSLDHLHYTCKHKRKFNDQKQVKPV
nr:retrovirus-related Pol polyprotein from transposon TNT 1-94 [Tanacetum cinerariifolium]